jgi:UPF0755 protein
LNNNFVQEPETEKPKKFWLKILVIAPIVIIILVLLSLGSFALFMRYYLYSHNERGTEVEFVVQKGQSVQSIAKDLEEKGLIKNDLPLLVYLKYKGLSGQLIAGEYRIKTDSTPMQIIDILTSGQVASQKITIPEGWTNKAIAEYLTKKQIVTKEEFLAAVKKKYSYDFLKDKPEKADLEGFLFPDTYQISYHATADDIVKKMLDNFDKKLTSSMRAEIKTSGFTSYEILTLASMVEREVAKPEDRKVVAGIFLSRLKEGTPLESCATIQYILNVNKTQFSYEETRTPSPYNTYINKSLPPGPIGNPGLESIEAVLRPQITEYRYFLSAGGNTYYSKTLAEHEAKKAKYLK